MIPVLVILNLWSWTIWTLSSKHQDQAHHHAVLVFSQHSYMQLWILSCGHCRVSFKKILQKEEKSKTMLF